MAVPSPLESFSSFAICFRKYCHKFLCFLELQELARRFSGPVCVPVITMKPCLSSQIKCCLFVQCTLGAKGTPASPSPMLLGQEGEPGCSLPCPQRGCRLRPVAALQAVALCASGAPPAARLRTDDARRDKRPLPGTHSLVPIAV